MYIQQPIITFCGVGSHHQNGIAEQKIKDITLGAQTLLVHAKQMFPEYISTILWPFAVKCYEDWMNHLVHCADGRTPKFRIFIPLAVHAMSWIIVCNRDLGKFLGNLVLGWVFMLDAPRCML